MAGRRGGELMGALDRRPRLLSAPPLRPLHRAGVVDMHLGASLPPFESLPDPLVFRQRIEQRLRLCDLRHFRRRRKALERRREGGVGFGGAAGRVVEVGERQRGAQFETARPLLLCDADGGLEGFFRGRGAVRILVKQELAARAMELGCVRSTARAIAGCQRLVEDHEASRRISGASFRLGDRDLKEPVVVQNATLLQEINAVAHALEPARRAARLVRPPSEKLGESAISAQFVLSRQAREVERDGRRAPRRATHQIENRRLPFSERPRNDMSELGCSRLHLVGD